MIAVNYYANFPAMETLHTGICFICIRTWPAYSNECSHTLCLHIKKILFSLTLTGEQIIINIACLSRQHLISYHPFSDWDARQKHGARLLIQKENTSKLQVFKDTFNSQWQGYSLRLYCKMEC